MLNDITFGQYFPTGSVIHRLDPRAKLLLLIALIVLIFFAGNFIALALSVIFIACVLSLSKIPFKMYLKNIKAILPIIIFTAAINCLYVNEGAVLLDWWIFTITTGGISRAIFMAVRVALLILISAVLTYTTTPNQLTHALESLLSPAKYIGLGNIVHVLSLTMTIALRFIPILIEETQRIMNAQKARGADLESGGFISRVKALIPILIPLLVLSIRRSYDLADAMECRCYNGGKGCRRMKRLKFRIDDLIALICCLVFVAGIILLNIFF